MTVRQVRLSEAARDDTHRLAQFLVDKNPKAAEKASDAISHAVLSLDELSERGRPAGPPGWRELVVRFGRAAYIIQYFVEPNTVFVARIFHSDERR